MLDPSWHQEGVKSAKLEPRWWQVGAKSGQSERRGGLRSDLETKSRILKLVVFPSEYVYFVDIGAAKWRQVGDKIWKDEVNIAKMEQRRQEAATI